jgi:hypothetical protein
MRTSVTGYSRSLRVTFRSSVHRKGSYLIAEPVIAAILTQVECGHRSFAFSAQDRCGEEWKRIDTAHIHGSNLCRLVLQCVRMQAIGYARFADSAREARIGGAAERRVLMLTCDIWRTCNGLLDGRPNSGGIADART